jgi:hypothetical protein
VNAGRLLLLAEHLDTVPAELFTMSHWWCGSAGCAMGHACDVPEFRDLGLYRVRYDVRFCSPNNGWVLSNYDAAEVLFDLTTAQAGHLFNSVSYRPGVTPGEVAGHIREFVESGGRVP